jgi:fructose 1,6-bisphosphatase
VPDDDQPFQIAGGARKSSLSPVMPAPVRNNQIAAFDGYPDAVPA